MREGLSRGQDKRAGPVSPKSLSAHRFFGATRKFGGPWGLAFHWVIARVLAGPLPPNYRIIRKTPL